MKAVLYGRVSTPEQVEGYSIDAQKRAFKLLCQGRGWEATHEYIDEGKSARTDKIAKRPAFRQAMADAQSHAYDVLVVHKLDRFSRNLRITLESLDVLAKAGVAFVSITEQMDFATPWGKLSLNMLGGMAQFYSDNLASEVKKGKNERKAQGLYNGMLPFGVMKGPDGVPKRHDEVWTIRDDKGNTVQERPPTYEGLRLAFDLASKGETDKAIAEALNVKGYRTYGTHGANPFSKDTVSSMLQNRFYLGELPDGKGGWVTDNVKHRPMIKADLFEAAEQTRARRRSIPLKIRSDAHRYSLSGIAHCAICGSRLRVFDKARMLCNQRIQRGGCSQPSARLSIVDDQMRAYLTALKLPLDYRDRMLEYTQADNSDAGPENETARIKATLNRIKELYTWGDKSRSEYLAERHALQARLSQLAVSETGTAQMDQVAEFLGNLAAAWDAADQENRNRLATELFENVWLKDGLVEGVSPRPDMVPYFDLVYAGAVKDALQWRTRPGTGWEIPMGINERPPSVLTRGKTRDRKTS